MDHLADWFRANGLALNLDKTCFMRFHLAGRVPSPIKVIINSSYIQQVLNTKLLGFVLDTGLVWDAHIDHLCAKLGGACFALRRLAATANTEVVKACYFASVHSIISYGTELWARAADRLRVFRMQKRAVRAIVGIKDDESTRGHFKKLNLLTLPSIYIYQVAVYVIQNKERFELLGDSHNYDTRHKGRLRSVAHKLARSNKSARVIGPAVFNRLPKSVRDAASTAIFKHRLKLWLIDNEFYDFEGEFMKLPLL